MGGHGRTEVNDLRAVKVRPCKTPRPIPIDRPWDVHPCLAAEPHNVLKGNDRKAGRRGQRIAQDVLNGRCPQPTVVSLSCVPVYTTVFSVWCSGRWGFVGCSSAKCSTAMPGNP